MLKLRNARRTITMTAAALAVAGGAALAGSGTANAASAGPFWVRAVGPNHVGVYAQPGLGGKVGLPDLNPGDYAYVDCFVVGGNVGNAGDVWYHTTWVYYPTQGGAEDYAGNSWTFAPYLDNASAWRTGTVPNCNA